MFGVKLAEKRTKEEEVRVHSARKESQWLRKYNSEVKPRLLERYDSRVGAFLRQAEEAPADPSRVSHHVQSSKLRPFRFRDAGTPRAQEEGVLRSSAYAPLSSYQFRDRNKEKELPPKIEQRVLRLRRWQKELHQAAARRREDCLSKPSGENMRALY